MKRLLLPVLVLLLSAGASAQAPDYRRELGNARVLERAGNQAEAIAIYEKIFAEQPEYQAVFPYLKAAYMKAGMYDRLIEACAVASKIRPKDTSVYMALGEAWAAKGENDRAVQSWEEIIRIDPENRNNYATAGYELGHHGMQEEEIEVYQRGEKVLGETAFARELARAYERMGDYGKAADEVIVTLTGDPKGIVGIERDLKRLMQRSSNSIVMEVVKSRAKKEPDLSLIHRVLGDLYLLNGEYGEALREYTRSDAEEPLWELGRKAEEEGLYEAALQSYGKLAETKGAFAPQARFRTGIVLEADGKCEQAIETYKAFIHDFPGDSQAPLAKYRIGVVRLDGLSDPKGGLVYFESLVASDVPGPVRLDSKFLVAECNLRLGNIAEASRTLGEIVKGSASDRALFSLGEALYYEGEFDSAVVLFERVVNEHPQSEYVNDALARSVFVASAGGDKESLQRFALAERLLYSREYDSAIEGFKSLLADEPESKVADDCVLRIAEALEGKRSYNEAIAAYRDLASLYPKSTLRPEAQRRIGELFAERLGDKKTAIAELENVLLNYPDYVLSGTVRNRIEELKGVTEH
jgi:tetratricopeptide (TPR) repeat protein